MNMLLYCSFYSFHYVFLSLLLTSLPILWPLWFSNVHSMLKSRIIFYKVHKLWGSSAWFIDEAGTWARLTERVSWVRAAYPGVSAVHLCLDRVLKRPKHIFYTFYIVIAFLDTHISWMLIRVAWAKGHAICDNVWASMIGWSRHSANKEATSGNFHSTFT